MRKILLLLSFSLFLSTLFAQVTGVNYKAIVSDNTGSILSGQSVTIQFTIFEGDPLDNNITYVESHTTTTDDNGLLTVHIGEGTTTDEWGFISWGDDLHFLKTEYDIGGGYVDMGTQDFKFVPYAHFTLNALNAQEAGSVHFNNVTNTPTNLAGYGVEQGAFNQTGGTTISESVTDNIYHTGKLAIGTTEADAVNAQQFVVKTDFSNIVIGSNTAEHNAISIESDTQRGNGLESHILNGYTLASKAALKGISQSDYITSNIAYFEYRPSFDDKWYGLKNEISSSYSSNIFIGVENSIENNSSGSGMHIGTYNTLTGTGTAEKTGTYNYIDPAAGGMHYGIFAEATKTGSYAGYFKGDVHITQELNVDEKITAPDSGSTDMKAYIYGRVKSDGAIETSASSDGFSVAKTGTGNYKITFTNSPGSAYNYIVVANATASGPRIVNQAYYSSYFNIYIFNHTASTVDQDFSFVVYKK